LNGEVWHLLEANENPPTLGRGAIEYLMKVKGDWSFELTFRVKDDFKLGLQGLSNFFGL
jgi:hypothetical protein